MLGQLPPELLQVVCAQLDPCDLHALAMTCHKANAVAASDARYAPTFANLVDIMDTDNVFGLNAMAARDKQRTLAMLCENASLASPRVLTRAFALGLDPNARSPTGRTLLFDVAPNAVGTLVANGADLECTSSLGRTPFLDAVRACEPSKARALAAAGANVLAKDDDGNGARELLVAWAEGEGSHATHLVRYKTLENFVLANAVAN